MCYVAVNQGRHDYSHSQVENPRPQGPAVYRENRMIAPRKGSLDRHAAVLGMRCQYRRLVASC